MTNPSPFVFDPNEPATPPPPASPVPPPMEAPQPNRVPMTWMELWASALTSPKESTYEDIMADPKAKTSPYIWLAISFLVATLISLVMRMIFGAAEIQMFRGWFEQFVGNAGPLNNPGLDNASPIFGSSILATICCLPVGVIIELIIYIIDVAFITLFAKIVGGKGSFSELAFAFSAFTVPATIFSTIIASVPFVNCLGIFIAIYILVLRCFAVKVVHKLSWGRTIVATFVIPLVLILVLFALLFGLAYAAISAFIQHNPSILNGLST
jgi:hypothetical protein